MTTRPPSLETIRADFEFLDDWEDRYRYVIELGRALPPLADAAHNDVNKVRGCASQVWLQTNITPSDEAGNPKLTFGGDSDASIVKGLIAILFAIYSERTAREIAATDAHAVFAKLGLNEHLTPQRSNGLASMVERVKSDAAAALVE